MNDVVNDVVNDKINTFNVFKDISYHMVNESTADCSFASNAVTILLYLLIPIVAIWGVLLLSTWGNFSIDVNSLFVSFIAIISESLDE